MRLLLLVPLLACALEGQGAGDCADGADNDGDGAFDCDDEGCDGAPDCDNTGPDINTDTDTGTTPTTGDAPVIEELSVEPYDGLYDFGDSDQPAILVEVYATDADGNLNLVAMDVWWDDTIDGSVDISGTPGSDGDFYQVSTTDGVELQDGEGFNVRFGTHLNVNGERFAYVTLYEFAVTVTDSHGAVSEPAIATGTTPNKDGSLP